MVDHCCNVTRKLQEICRYIARMFFKNCSTITGTLQECFQKIAGMMVEHWWNSTGVLSGCCWNAAEFLLDVAGYFFWNIIGSLPECCWTQIRKPQTSLCTRMWIWADISSNFWLHLSRSPWCICPPAPSPPATQEASYYCCWNVEDCPEEFLPGLFLRSCEQETLSGTVEASVVVLAAVWSRSPPFAPPLCHYSSFLGAGWVDLLCRINIHDSN